MNGYLLTKTPILRKHRVFLATCKRAYLEEHAVYIHAWVLQQDGRSIAISIAEERPDFLIENTGIAVPARQKGVLEHEAASRKDSLWGDLKRAGEFAANFISPHITRAKRFIKMRDASVELQEKQIPSLTPGTQVWLRLVGRCAPWQRWHGELLKAIVEAPSSPAALRPLSELYDVARRRYLIAATVIFVCTLGSCVYNCQKLVPMQDLHERLRVAEREAEGARLEGEALKIGRPVMADIQKVTLLNALVSTISVSNGASTKAVLLVYLNRGAWLESSNEIRMNVLRKLCSLWGNQTHSQNAQVALMLPPVFQAIPKGQSLITWKPPHAIKVGACNDGSGQNAWIEKH